MSDLKLILLENKPIANHNPVSLACELEEDDSSHVRIVKWDREEKRLKQQKIKHGASINDKNLYSIVYADPTNMCSCQWCWTIRKLILTNQGMGVEILL